MSVFPFLPSAVALGVVLGLAGVITRQDRVERVWRHRGVEHAVGHRVAFRDRHLPPRPAAVEISKTVRSSPVGLVAQWGNRSLSAAGYTASL